MPIVDCWREERVTIATGTRGQILIIIIIISTRSGICVTSGRYKWFCSVKPNPDSAKLTYWSKNELYAAVVIDVGAKLSRYRGFKIIDVLIVER